MRRKPLNGGPPVAGIEICPDCGNHGVDVKDSRPCESGRRRRRVCQKCGYRWTTIEQPVDQVFTEAQQRLAKDYAVMKLGRDLKKFIENYTGD